MKKVGSIIKSAILPEFVGIVVDVDEYTHNVASLYRHSKKGNVTIIISEADVSVAGTWYCDTWETRRVPSKDLEFLGTAEQASVDQLLRAMGRTTASAYYHFAFTGADFVPGSTPVPVSGKVWGPEEMENLVEASFDFWLTSGRFNDAFEKRFAQTLDVSFALTVNSGSSANLLAVSALTSPLLKNRRLLPGDEVITVAAGFPTTVTPLLQHNLVPVFVDVDPETANVLTDQLEAALTPKTKAIILAHTLGNPFNLEAILEIKRKYNLWLIEDSCDALGSTYTLSNERRYCGTFGDIGTFSFYPAHHITMGEGGSVVTDNNQLYRILLSLRDWGRDCWCPPGRDNTCKHRYSHKYGDLPVGYDHKYVYSHIGYNLKITDMQAAVGLAQLSRLEAFSAQRRSNFAYLNSLLETFPKGQMFLPKATPHSEPSWFGYLITLNERYDRTSLLRYLEKCKVGTRLLFAGNMTRQPCFAGAEYKMPFKLVNTDRIMNQSFWLGVYHGLDELKLDHTAQCLADWFSAQQKGV